MIFFKFGQIASVINTVVIHKSIKSDCKGAGKLDATRMCTSLATVNKAVEWQRGSQDWLQCRPVKKDCST